MRALNMRAYPSLLAVACLVAASIRPAAAQDRAPVAESWQEGDPVPPGYQAIRKNRRGLIAAGVVLFGSMYTIDIIGAGGNAFFGGPSREAWLVVPGVGPLVLMAETTNAPGNVLLAVDALVEISGIAMLAYGLAAPRTALVHDAPTTSFAITPMFGSGRAGVGVVGLF